MGGLHDRCARPAGRDGRRSPHPPRCAAGPAGRNGYPPGHCARRRRSGSQADRGRRAGRVARRVWCELGRTPAGGGAMLLELAVGAAETVLGAKACRWVRLLSAQAEAKQAAVFQAADPLPVASAVRCGNRAGRVQGLLRGRVEAFQLAQEEVEVAAATLVVAGAFEHRHECRAAVTLQQFQQGSGGSRIGLPERLGHRFAPTARVTADEGARRHFVAFQQRIDLLGQFRRVAVDAQGDPQAGWSGAFEQVFQGTQRKCRCSHSNRVSRS